MTSPAPVPSKAAIHALRGIIFGTSCSIVLLAEERRRRISIARSAVENGRKLKSLKCYSSAASAALEAVHDDAAAEVSVLNWLRPQRRDPETRWFQEKLEFGDSDTDKPAPDPRLPRLKRSPATSRLPIQQERKREKSIGLSPRVRIAPHLQRKKGLTPRKRLQICVPELKTIHPALEEFWASAISAAAEAPLQELGIDRQTHKSAPVTPAAALELVSRAVATVDAGRPLPPWLLQLSGILSVACQRQGDYEVAGRMLSLLCSRGPINQTAYLAHNPLDIVQHLTTQDNLRGIKARALEFRLCLSAELLSAVLEDDSGWRAAPAPVAVAQNILGLLVQHNLENIALSTFQKLRPQCQLEIWTSFAFINQLWESGYFTHTIDAYIDLSGSVGTLDGSKAVNPITDKLYGRIFQALKATHGYRAIDTFKAMQRLHAEADLQLAVRWMPDILQSYWNESRHLDRTILLHAHILRFIAPTPDTVYHGVTYKTNSVMVQIILDAGDLPRAQREWQKLQASCSQEATKDIETPGTFARYHAKAGNWDSVRAGFEQMSRLRSVTVQLQADYSNAFGRVLDEFLRTHTWSESRQFVEEYVRDLHVPLDHATVNKLVQWHGRCRDYKGLRSWLLFCEGSGVELPSPFWLSLFSDARRAWAYKATQLLALYQELESCIGGGEADRARLKKRVQDAAGGDDVALPLPAKEQEPSLLNQMSSALSRGHWSGVLRIYQDTSRGNADSAGGRCLQLVVRSCINMGREDDALLYVQKAQAEGHDVSEATTTLALAELDCIEAATQQTVSSRPEVRPSPYPAIQDLLRRLQADGRIDNRVFSKAAQVCLALRNYQEAIAVCVTAAQANGRGDLCYNVNNFANLSQAFLARHEYDKLQWLMERVQDKHYRIGRYCLRSLLRTAQYLRVASQQEKAEELRSSDLAMLGRVEQVLHTVKTELANVYAQMDNSLSEPESDVEDGDVEQVLHTAETERANVFAQMKNPLSEPEPSVEDGDVEQVLHTTETERASLYAQIDNPLNELEPDMEDGRIAA